MMIIVCPLSRVRENVRRHQPDRVISLLDPDGDFPELGEEYRDRHLRLRLHDITIPGDDPFPPSPAHVAELLRFIAGWNRARPLLVHCHAGISRSTATAFIAACYVNPGVDEAAIAAALRSSAPLSRPNERLVQLADEAMGRGGRMTEAIRSTGRDLLWPMVEEGEPFRIPSTFAAA